LLTNALPSRRPRLLIDAIRERALERRRENFPG